MKPTAAMIENKDEPAFPVEMIQINSRGKYAPAVFAGLTKREYIAALAFQGLCSHSGDYHQAEHLAQDAVMYADALIRRLETPK